MGNERRTATHVSLPGEDAGGARLAWAAILALYLFTRLTVLTVPLDRDEGLFGLIGQRMWSGELPYRDWCEQKPPGLFYIYALIAGFFPNSASGVHFALLLWNLATLWLVASLGAAWAGRPAGRWCAFFYTIVSSLLSLQGATTSSEMLGLLPLVASLRLATAAAQSAGARRNLWLLGSGACGALACWTKQPLVFSLLAIPAWFTADAWSAWRTRRRAAAAPPPPAPYVPSSVETGRRAPRRGGPVVEPGPPPPGGPGGPRLLADGALWLAGGLVLSGLVCLPFMLTGTLGEMFYWSFVRSSMYRGFAPVEFLPTLWQRAKELLPDCGVFLALSVLTVAWSAWHRRRRWWAFPLLLLLSFVGACHTPMLYWHYFAQVAPGLALTCGVGLAGLFEALPPAKRGPWRLALGAAVILLSVSVPFARRPWYYFPDEPAVISDRMFGHQAFEAGPVVARYLKEHTAPDDWLFVYGSEPQIAFLAQRRVISSTALVGKPSEAVIEYLMTQEGEPSGPALEPWDRTWAAIADSHPRYIVVPWCSSQPAPGPEFDVFAKLLPWTSQSLSWCVFSHRFFRKRMAELMMKSYEPEQVLVRMKPVEFAWLPPTEPALEKEWGSVVYVLWRRRE